MWKNAHEMSIDHMPSLQFRIIVGAIVVILYLIMNWRGIHMPYQRVESSNR